MRTSLRCSFTAVFGLTALAAPVAAQEDYKSTRQAFEAVQERYFAAKRQARGRSEQAEAKRLRPDPARWRQRFWSIVKQDAGADDALSAIEWILRHEPDERDEVLLVLSREDVEPRPGANVQLIVHLLGSRGLEHALHGIALGALRGQLARLVVPA